MYILIIKCINSTRNGGGVSYRMIYCSMCGDEIEKGQRYYIEDGKIVCDECFTKTHDDKESKHAEVFRG